MADPLTGVRRPQDHPRVGHRERDRLRGVLLRQLAPESFEGELVDAGERGVADVALEALCEGRNRRRLPLCGTTCPMAERRRQRAPNGLRPAGRAIWAAVTADHELEAHEQALLTELCRVKDRLDALAKLLDAEGVLVDGRVHPALVEARHLGITFARLVAALRLPPGEDDDVGQRPQRRVGVRGVYGLVS
jgi:hypothetical protein